MHFLLLWAVAVARRRRVAASSLDLTQGVAVSSSCPIRDSTGCSVLAVAGFKRDVGNPYHGSRQRAHFCGAMLTRAAARRAAPPAGSVAASAGSLPAQRGKRRPTQREPAAKPEQAKRTKKQQGQQSNKRAAESTETHETPTAEVRSAHREGSGTSACLTVRLRRARTSRSASVRRKV